MPWTSTITPTIPGTVGYWVEPDPPGYFPSWLLPERPKATQWALRVLSRDFRQIEVVPFARAELAERYLAADGLVIEGATRQLRSFIHDGYGAVLTDSDGALRFSGLLFDWQKSGDKTSTLTFVGDLWRVFARILYPDPTRGFSQQTTVEHDVSSGPLETRLLHYINMNAGPGALSYRRVAGLTVPTSLGRGRDGTSLKRFESLTDEIPHFAELAGLRVTVLRQPDGTLPLTVTQPPDYSTSALAPRLADETWTHSEQVATATTALIAGGGKGTARVTTEVTDTAAEARIGGRFETYVDQRDTSVIADLDDAGQDALVDAQSTRSVEANVTANSQLPVGTLVTLLIDGVPVTDRIRERVTVIAGGEGDATVSVTSTFGTPDSGLTVQQRQMEFVERRLGKLTRMESV